MFSVLSLNIPLENSNFLQFSKLESHILFMHIYSMVVASIGSYI